MINTVTKKIISHDSLSQLFPKMRHPHFTAIELDPQAADGVSPLQTIFCCGSGVVEWAKGWAKKVTTSARSKIAVIVIQRCDKSKQMECSDILSFRAAEHSWPYLMSVILHFI